MPNDLALARAVRAGHPSTFQLSRSAAPVETEDELGSDCPPPDMASPCAHQRQAAERACSIAVALRSELSALLSAGDETAADRVAAAADRAAAAQDRYEAALDRHRAADELRRSSRDLLTGALRRDGGLERLQRALKRTTREHVPFVLAFLDVDGLKAINDARGHLAGDSVLRSVGDALRRNLRNYDLCVRFGGDEFICALTGTTLVEARHRCERVQHVLAELQPGCSVSFGLAEPRTTDSFVALLARADAALYAGRRLRAAGASTSPP